MTAVVIDRSRAVWKCQWHPRFLGASSFYAPVTDEGVAPVLVAGPASLCRCELPAFGFESRPVPASPATRRRSTRANWRDRLPPVGRCPRPRNSGGDHPNRIRRWKRCDDCRSRASPRFCIRNKKTENHFTKAKRAQIVLRKRCARKFSTFLIINRGTYEP